MNRTCDLKRKTTETDIEIHINLDGTGKTNINTGIGFFDHMLTTLGKHSRIDLQISARGDLEVDDHHTIEDVGICVGQVMRNALGNKGGIQRFGWAYCPLDESLSRVVVDLSGRSSFIFDSKDESDLRLQQDSLMEFLRAFSSNSGTALHIDLIRGLNRHHAWESIFKALALALRQAVLNTPDIDTIPSTKGILE